MKELKEYATNQKKLQIASGSAWTPMLDDHGNPVNLLFTKPNGFPSHPDGLTGRWRDIVKRFNLPPLNLHGLRHTYASYMVSKNVNFKIIQEQLGHSDIKQTLNTYSHLTDKDKNNASDLFNEIL
ncbi:MULTISPECIES: site-specific integrase [Cytobacillus]|nr:MULTISPECIES: site-specific integrase [Cytobacillus]